MRRKCGVISLFFLIGAITFIFYKDKNNLENSVWKYCGNGKGDIADVLDFRKQNYFIIKNNGIYVKETLIGMIDRVEYYYIERRLFVESLAGDIGRYCER
ncbi:hypothetical protein QJU23_09875 [Pasteurella atlantica]|uniref:Uncharacterized protein n=2 Tax=Pasteurellaceae TaxID=712 RepID=A0ACC6HPJ3_9PAST|nr:hypothetical protein [Pasteurella atlantica]MDP8052718.1 hypothetical protein [Pasteurella atlantica]MDP8105991.1 hypothetical protein [Pasteurella atlantica]MDP8149400.1 hypothetical protein [Pasteurella atlantica]